MKSAAEIDKHWEIIETFEDPSNKDLLHALANGSNALRINFKSSLQIREIETLFKNIHLDFITLYLEGNTTAVELARKLTKKKEHQKIYLFQNKDFEEELISFLQEASSYLKAWSDDKVPIVIIKMNLEYLANISKIRCIKILWAHLLKSYKLKLPKLKIIADISEYTEDRSLEEDYIYASIQLMSSIAGSADGIEISVPDKSEKNWAFRSDITRNLHHLASLEARMNLVKDPLKGSYHIEKCSNQLAETAWKKFTK